MSAIFAGVAPAQKLLLNAGCGLQGPRSRHPCFAAAAWREVRLDIDPQVHPDVIGSVTDLRSQFGDASFDAIWSSHNVEHLYAHEVPQAFAEFRRVLKSDGFALITCPDLQSVAAGLLERGMDAVAYEAPAGPITMQDMMFGHGASIARGNTYMAHHSGFTQERLGRAALDAGFDQVRVGRGRLYDLWALLTMPRCDEGALKALVQGTDVAFLFADDAAGALG